MEDRYIKVILIDGPSKIIQEYEIRPSHYEIEDAIGTRFWSKRLLGNGDTLYHHVGDFGDAEVTYSMCGGDYTGSGLIVRLDRYHDLTSCNTPIEYAREIITFPEIADERPPETSPGGE
jgi:hypothetical protein